MGTNYREISVGPLLITGWDRGETLDTWQTSNSEKAAEKMFVLCAERDSPTGKESRSVRVTAATLAQMVYASSPAAALAEYVRTHG